MAGHVLKAANAEKAELVVVEMYGVACVACVACLCVVKGEVGVSTLGNMFFPAGKAAGDRK